ncbi:MAG: sugar phosphate isomerase/epimerase [Defluviitaleaceae bacterium]|nr:sugar phosphate isomerase/epimerase [Defluviitaleaceae bacterium]MCL2835578.1 sugar phosphate isomerase/epimerase [Defluviitaleaceae bacterium]
MKIAYTGWTWINAKEPETAKKQLEASFRECRYLGYDYVENFAFIRDFYAENPDELVELTKKYGVNLVNLYGHFGFDEAAALETAKKQVDFLAAIGGKWYNCQNSGFGDDGPIERPTNIEMINAMCRIADKLGEYAKTKGITLTFHSHYGTCVFSQSDIDHFAANTNPEYVSFCIDTAHVTLAGIDPVDIIKKLGARVAYVHLKDVDAHALSRADGAQKMGTFRALGLGTVDFPAVKAALEEIGYDGVLCVELDNPPICNYNSAEISRKYIKNALGF